ncbi:MAG TPA: arsinothricin resistance N-acetyltransferase ArsN1 family B [Herbaspirillum sp.]|uniref:arsinothricin resistance N-acetyltransferase ArsN1 family B n=1 Tax=Herbaspirillum sp. TaxID=1890675 RepID=UPI002D58114A|nr:arsinothricin resistance N-acetyltransferase ArsN1 family B [Herbaspirillum sp.]HZG22341.1 arsinothricin resistance N-acetyltransferase ArsN1 family B [Herbaspirillum sp.]
MHPSIRPATAADAAAICGIYNHYVDTTVISFETEAVTVEGMTARIAEVQSQFPWLVFEQEGEVLGYAYASKWKPRAAYQRSVESSVYLRHDAGGRGIGKLLYAELFAQLKPLGVHLVIGGIAQPNAASVALHESLGFVKCGVFSEVGYKMGRWIDVGYWQLKLQEAQ